MKLTDLPHRRSGKELVFQVCPFCSDRKWHFYFNRHKGTFYCFKCGEKGSARKLRRELRGEYEIEVERALEQEARKSSPPALPPGFESCLRPDGKITTPAYLLGRRIKPETMKHFGIGFLREGRMCSAVVFPYEFRGEKKYILRYTHQKSYKLQPGERGIYPCLRDGAPLGVLVEGPFDALWAWQCGLTGLALFGTKASKLQQEEINRLGDRVGKLVVAFDPDAPDESEALACSLSAAGNFERIGWLELGKDIDEYSPEEVLRIVREKTVWL